MRIYSTYVPVLCIHIGLLKCTYVRMCVAFIGHRWQDLKVGLQYISLKCLHGAV